MKTKDTEISLREYFAGLAMQGLISAQTYSVTDDVLLAKKAVMYSDALLEELSNSHDEDNKSKVNQEEFNQFFREILGKYKNGVCNIDIDNYRIYDDNNKWLFTINCNPENQWFCYSYARIFPLFKEKFGINEQELNKLMIPVLEQDFKLVGIKPEYYHETLTKNKKNILQ